MWPARPMTPSRPSEDLFEETRMSFGQHLEELRATLVRCLIGIGIGCVLGFLVADRVVNFLQTPLIHAIKQFNDRYALQDYEQRLGFYPPEIHNLIDQDGLAPDTVQVDPGQLIQAIRSISPDSFADVDLAPYRFSAANFRDPGSVARSLLEEKRIGDASSESSEVAQQRDQQVAAIARLIPADSRATLQSAAAAGTTGPAAARDLATVLNPLLDDRQLHESVAFEPMLVQPEWTIEQLLFPVPNNQLNLMKQVVEKNPADVELSRRLNRLLVARTFPGWIRPPGIDLVPLQIWQNLSEGTQALSAQEVFMVWMKAAIIVGLILSAPWCFFQIWKFVAAGLYPHEQKHVYIYMPISLTLFAAGVGLAFFFVFEPVLQFLFSFNASMGIKPQLRIGEWLTFVLFLPLGFGIAFQLPLVMLFVQRVGLVKTEVFTGHWRVAVMIISVLSMLLTPADPISMILLGVPLTFLYFFGIALCRWMPASQNPFAGDQPPAVSGDA